jgi:hypothetical protein
VQFAAHLSCDFGIGSNDLDGKLDLVNHSLAGAVPAGKQFEIFKAVIVRVAVDVMHSFFRSKFAFEILFHNVSMFKNLVHWDAVLSRYSQDNVAPLYSARDFWRSMFFSVDFADPLVLTLARAKFLRLVNGARFIAASFIKLFAAIFAISFVAFVSVFSPTNCRTGHRTIRRGFAELFLIGGDVRMPQRERLQAFSANEIIIWFSKYCATKLFFVLTMADGAAVFAVRKSGRNAKRLSAVLADFLNGHRGTPWGLSPRCMAHYSI